ncbi:nitrogen fixation protein VnfA [Muribaculaceae bacterium]|jgi:transcriptional regulator with PAS, ATPase and Fis domain|nr:nitrogen fixation protein VnfA [Muribaculaceae bacterium]
MNSITSTGLQAVKQRLGIVGSSPALLDAIDRALRVAPIDLSVLIIGESGTGKEFFPKIIHSAGARKHARYIAVNCGAIPEGTIDSELFGHEKGAFTGAISSRKGYFEEADGGTIFLDEVAELPLTTQARLLRVLESGEFLKVGSSTVQRTNIRVVAATNVDMAKAVAEGRFRQDLYYRLSTVQINVPPLRDRGSDITLLARKFAADFSERYSTPEISLSDDARTLLASYRWPGNVRQLKNVVEQLSLFEAGDEITRERLQRYLPAATFSPVVAAAAAPNDPSERSYAREREVLFNMIFRLREEVDSLRAELSEKKTAAPAMAAVTSAAMVPATQPQPPISHHRALINLPEETAATEVETLQEIVIPAIKTLEDTEKETIRESLERNGGRRKAAAAELRISERTLYRKIKEYGLE